MFWSTNSGIAKRKRGVSRNGRQTGDCRRRKGGEQEKEVKDEAKEGRPWKRNRQRRRNGG